MPVNRYFSRFSGGRTWRGKLVTHKGQGGGGLEHDLELRQKATSVLSVVEVGVFAGTPPFALKAFKEEPEVFAAIAAERI